MMQETDGHTYPVVQDLLLYLYWSLKNPVFSDRQFRDAGHARFIVSYQKVPTMYQNEKDREFRAYILSLSKVFKDDLKEATRATRNDEELARFMLQRGQQRMLEHVDKEANMRILRHRAEEAKEQQDNVLEAKQLHERKEQLDMMTKDAENEKSRITQCIADSQQRSETSALMLLSNVSFLGVKMREVAKTGQKEHDDANVVLAQAVELEKELEKDVKLLDPNVVLAQEVELDRIRHVVAKDTPSKRQRVVNGKKKHQKIEEATEQDMFDEEIEFVSMTHSEHGVVVPHRTSSYVNSSGASPYKAHAIPRLSSEASPHKAHANVSPPTLSHIPLVGQSPPLSQRLSGADISNIPPLVAPIHALSHIPPVDQSPPLSQSLSGADISNNIAPLVTPLYNPLVAPPTRPQIPIGVFQQGFNTRGSSYKPPSQQKGYKPSSRSCPPTSFNRVPSSSNSTLPSQIFQSKGPAPGYTPVYSKWVVSKTEGQLVLLRSNEKLPSFGFTSSVTDNSFDMSRIEPGEPFRVYNEKKQLMSCFVGFKLTHVTTDQYHRIVDFSILDKFGNPVKYMRC